MRILIVALGSRGDVQPYLALALGLKAQGHEITFCTCERFQSFIESYDINYGHIADDFIQLIDSDEGKDIIENTRGFWAWVTLSISMIKQVKPLINQAMSDVWKVAKEIKPQLIISGTKGGLANHIAEKLDVPEVICMPFPQLVPTADYPTLLFPALPLGGWYNRMSYKLVNLISGLYMKTTNGFRRDTLGLGPFKRKNGTFSRANGDAIPIFHCYSSAVIARPADWPDYAHVCGYWFLPKANDWQPDAELQQFLQQGPAPIYIGFGSMAGRRPEALAKIVIAALTRCGYRGIIASGWGGLKAEHLPDSILMVDQAPHDWLFPQMAAVMHHGGAGTTAAGLKAGKPSIICPFFADQPLWGQRVFELGIGPEPIPHKQLTVDNLSEAFRQVMTNQSMQDKAAAMGQLIESEDGIGNAVAIISQLTKQN